MLNSNQSNFIHVRVFNFISLKYKIAKTKHYK